MSFSVHAEKISSAAVGWGNLIVPGLGATLRDQPMRGVFEAALEVGTFYSGTLIAEETRFSIDGTIQVPENGSVRKPMMAMTLQQFGLKYHFYNTFYHYQQAALDDQDSEREMSNPQPLYKGTWTDTLLAPFRWENLSSIWAWPFITVSSAFLVWDYSQTTVVKRNRPVSGSGQFLYGMNEIGLIPLGSSFGEDVLFRGFIQREVYGMTKSLTAALLSQSILFAALHSDHLEAFAGGLYFGFATDQLHGDLGPVIAAHFWVDVVAGLSEFFLFRRSIGKDAPFSPPIVAQFQFPF